MRCATVPMLLLAIALAGTGGPAGAAEVQVAVAANFAAPMQRIAASFAAATGHTAVVAVGSTGRFYAQIRNGAPFEVLLSADDETPLKLEREGLAVAGTRHTYATGRLALWSAAPDRVDADASVLHRPPGGPLAIADPRLAPYGAAAIEAMTRLGVLAAWQPHLVQGESIGQAYQFVASGNAALGFVALSQVMTDGRIARGSGWIVPQALHTPLRQDAVLLNPGKDKPAALALLAHLRSESVQSLLRGYGYTP